MANGGGLTPVPDDAALNEWLQEQIDTNDKVLFVVLDDLKQAIHNNEENGTPHNFAYGRLLNYLRSEADFSEPDRIRLLAAALWELANDV